MIGSARVLGIITARGGSKGVPGKNLRIVGGQPLIAWTIQTAQASLIIDQLVLSSEDAEIMRVAASYGCEVPFRRPEELARDETPGILPVLDTLERITGFDIAVLLQPTSPLRLAQDIDGCIQQLVAGNAPACVAITEVEDNPLWMYWLRAEGRMEPVIQAGEHAVLRRQDLPSAYRVNGAVYAARVDFLKATQSFETSATVGYVMPAGRSLDIDTEADLAEADAALRGRAH